MNIKTRLASAAFVSLLVPTCLVASHWPGWRGGEAMGVASSAQPPLTWSAKEHVKWRVDLPERGNSSPIVWGDRVFVTQAITEGKKRTLLCFDRATGKQLWQSGTTYTEEEATQRDNPYCSATPVTDGERVIAFFGSAGVFCYDFAGKELWKRELGSMSHMFGNGSSPILVGDTCVVNFGPDEKARLVALDKKTGKILWEAQPPKVDASEQPARNGGGSNGASGGGERANRGEGQRGGGGGFGGGSGNRLVPQIFPQADADGDKKLTEAEFTALAAKWFEKIDSEKKGSLSAEQFAERFYQAVPPADGQAPTGPSRTTAPAIFTAADGDKNGSMTVDELKALLGKWYASSDKEKSGSLTAESLTEGLNAALPRQQGGNGGGGGGRGGRGGGGGGGGGSWSTPIVISVAGKQELIVGMPNRLVAYDPATGSQLWMSKGLGSGIYTTPIWGEGMVFASTSGVGGGPAIAVTPGGMGDVTESKRLWQVDRMKSTIGTGVISGGHLFTIGQDGVAGCFNAKTGEKVWEERLKGSGSRGGSWSSMLLVGDKIYVPNQSGDVFVLKASPTFEVVATNSVNEPTNASLAVADKELFLRTDKALWCFSE